MDSNPSFDAAAAHKYFAALCFNSAWELIEKADRTAEDNRLMEILCHASIYHWLQRPDCNSQRLSVGYWQAARVQALLGNAAEAERSAQICMSFSKDLTPFYRGYAHEALARAASVAGDSAMAKHHVEQATALAKDVEKDSDRAALINDLSTV